jgi:hypothetical protein
MVKQVVLQVPLWHQQRSAFGISVYVQTPTALEVGEFITERGVHFCRLISGSNLNRWTQKHGILVCSYRRHLSRKQFSIWTHTATIRRPIPIITGSKRSTATYNRYPSSLRGAGYARAEGSRRTRSGSCVTRPAFWPGGKHDIGPPHTNNAALPPDGRICHSLHIDSTAHPVSYSTGMASGYRGL